MAGAGAREGPWWLSGVSGPVLCWPAHAAAVDRSAVADLQRGFAQPPATARPWVYWFWLNGNITRGGITADLEAMHRVGIGGVLIMEVDQGVPDKGRSDSPAPRGGSCSNTSAGRRTGSA